MIKKVTQINLGSIWYLLEPSQVPHLTNKELVEDFNVSTVMVHYCEKLMGVVVFAKVQGQVKFESPRTRRVRGLSDFASPRTFVKTTTPINSSQ